MKKHTIIYTLLSILLSCQTNNIDTINEDAFKDEITLKISSVKTSEILNVDDFFVKDSLVIVRNNREDSLFMIYALPDFKCLKAFGKKGKGPHEYILPRIIDKPFSKEMFIADFALKKISKFNVNIPEKDMMTLDYSGYLPQSIYYSLDSFFIFDTNQQEVKLQKMKEDGTSIVLHDFENLKKKYTHSNVYFGFMGINDSLKRIVYAYQYLRRFDILDYDGNVLKQIKIMPYSNPKLHEDRIDTKNSMNYYLGVRTTTKSFFLYYVGHTGKDLTNNLNVTTYIEEYDWNGKPLKRYKLNRFIWGFDFLPDQNSEKNKFIGLDQSLPNPFVILTTDFVSEVNINLTSP